MSATRAVPNFFLYGEPPQDAGPNFAHVEPIHVRSRTADWTIRAHSHADLCHLLFISAGGGAMRAEGSETTFRAPAMLVVTAGVVHEFHFNTDTEGYVLTLSDANVSRISTVLPYCQSIFDTPCAVDLTLAEFSDHDFLQHLVRLEGELLTRISGWQVAVEGRLLCIFAGAIRTTSAPARTLATSPRALLVQGFRRAVNQRFRSGASIESYAKELGVTASRLRAACTTIANASPAEILHERIMAEAKRLLLYTDLPVAEIGYHLGFDEPAYFSRFFTKREGRSPSAVRASLGSPL